MNSYDPETPPHAAEWLQTDEGKRIELVSSYHHRKKVRLPKPQLHAVIHVILENQLALGETVVAETLDRLMSEGLTRHDALHAMGYVLVGDMYELMQETGEATGDAYRRYLEGIQKLTADSWRAG